VKAATPGDFVLLSFSFCGTCGNCEAGHPGYCHDFLPLNHAKGRGAFKSAGSEDVQGLFIGQSSFSSLALTTENSVTNVSGIVKNEEDLKLYSPLGCGFMTGAGTVAKLCKTTARDTVVVMGLGGVGLAALMVRILCLAPRLLLTSWTRRPKSLGAHKSSQ
jgi:Zn-dependent alcohol dehydrogenase